MAVIELKSRALTVLLTQIRDQNCPLETYISGCDRVCRILAEEGLAALAEEKTTVMTPCGRFDGIKPVDPRTCCAVSIVRSGDILLEAVRQVAIGIGVGKILIQRDEETAKPQLFYSKLPKDISKRKVLLVDPMLATGGSAITAMQVLIEAGCRQEDIIFLNTVAAPEGIKALNAAYPKLRIVTSAIDECLNEKSYIVPGMGDFGDRYYSTE